MGFLDFYQSAPPGDFSGKVGQQLPRVFFGSSCLLDFLRSYRFFTQLSEFPEFRDFRLSWGASHSHGLAMSAHPRPGIASPSYCRGPPALPGIPGTRWTSSVRPRDGPGTVFRLPIRCFLFSCLVRDGPRLLLPDCLACEHQPENWQSTFRPQRRCPKERAADRHFRQHRDDQG